MTPAFAFFTFLNAWWIMMFFVLPFFTVPAREKNLLEYAAAPQGLRWKKLLLVNTLASIAVTGLLALLLHSGLIPLRDVVI